MILVSMLCMLCFKCSAACMYTLQSRIETLVPGVKRCLHSQLVSLSFSAMAPVVAFPCRHDGFHIVDYHSRSSTALQTTCQRMLLPLPTVAANIPVLEAPGSLVQDLDVLGGVQHASLPAFESGAGLLQLRRDRARVHQMHSGLQPRPLAISRQLPLCDVRQQLSGLADLTVDVTLLEACIAAKQQVCSMLCVCCTSVLPSLWT